MSEAERWVALGVCVFLLGFMCWGLGFTFWMGWDAQRRYKAFCREQARQQAEVAGKYAARVLRAELVHELECERALLTNEPLPDYEKPRPDPRDDPYPSVYWKWA